MMKPWVVVVMSALPALAAEAPLAGASTQAVMAELRRLDSAAYHGKGDRVRAELVDLARAKSGDPMPRVYQAWLAGPTDEAWNQLKGVSQIFPENPWPHWGMARIYVSWKMRDPAKQELAIVLKRDPKFFPAMVTMGDLLRQAEDLAGAEAQYRAALAIEDDAEARAGLGLVLASTGKADAARAELKKSIAAWPDQPKALDALLKLAVDAKDPDAPTIASKLCDLQPKNRDARRQLALMRDEAGNKAEAAKEYERLIRLGTMELRDVKRLTELYRELGDTDGEDRSLQALAVLDKKNADIAMRSAELRAAKGDFEGTEGQLLEALQRDGSRVDAQLKLAQSYLGRKSYTEALDQFRVVAAKQAPEAETAKAEVKKLEEHLRLPPKPAVGDPNAVQYRVSTTLEKLAEERRKELPELQGKLRLRVRVAADSAVEGVDILEDTVGDPLLLGHVYFGLKDAQYPKKKREPVFEFELVAKKAK